MHITRLRSSKFAALVAAVTLLFSLMWSATPALAVAPAAPVVSTLTQSTTTTPIILSGTAEASSTIMVTGGASSATASTTAGGDWSLSVNLTSNTTNVLSVVAINSGAEVSSTSTVSITHDTNGPASPIVTFPTTPHSTSTNPITISGTAEASSTVNITGGTGTSSATVSGSGNWNASVGLASGANTLSVSATDGLGNTSSSTSLSITLFAASTSSPVITLVGNSTISIFACDAPFVEPGFSAVDSTGATITASSTGSVTANVAGDYTITYTATDSFGNTTTVTRAVAVHNCSSGGGSSRSSSSNGNNGISVAASVTPSGSVIPGQAIGLNLFQQFLLPPGQVQVLGAATFQFASDLSFGSRGPEVTELQRRLSEVGYFSGPITGYFGGKTRASLQRLQRANDMQVTGMLDAQTRFMLNS